MKTSIKSRGVKGRAVTWRGRSWIVAGVENMRVFGPHLTLKAVKGGKYALALRCDVKFTRWNPFSRN